MHNDFSQFVSSDVAVDLRLGLRISTLATILHFYTAFVLYIELTVFVCVVVCVLYLCSNRDLQKIDDQIFLNELGPHFTAWSRLSKP